MQPKVCKRCQSYLLDHRDPLLQKDKWKSCPNCNWCCDYKGENLVDKKEEKENEQEIQRQGAKSNLSENE